MFLQEIATDVTLEASGRKMRAHKCILRSRCQYFAAILAGNWIAHTGNVIPLPGYSYSVRNRYDPVGLCYSTFSFLRLFTLHFVTFTPEPRIHPKAFLSWSLRHYPTCSVWKDWRKWRRMLSKSIIVTTSTRFVDRFSPSAIDNSFVSILAMLWMHWRHSTSSSGDTQPRFRWSVQKMPEMGLQALLQSRLDATFLPATAGRPSAMPAANLCALELGNCSQLDSRVRRYAEKPRAESLECH